MVVITDLQGSPIPHYFPNLYATTNFQQVGRSPNTIEKALRALGMAKCWAETKSRDLDEDLAEGNFLNSSDVNDVVNFLGLNAADQASMWEAATGACRSRSSRIASLSGNGRNAAGKDASAGATNVERGSRIRALATYLEWHRHRRFDNRKLSDTETHLNDSAKASIAELRDKAPSVSMGWQDDESLEAPDISLLKRIEEILHPESAENPFSSDFVRWRNYLAWRLLSDTGARRSEISSAATDSVSASRGRFEIRESKTIRRTVNIINRTADVFDHFFENFWLNFPPGCEAHRVGSLFTDERGRPLTSGKFMNRIFIAVRKITGPQPWTVTPHMMRRAWNHLLSLKLDSLPPEKRFSPQEEAEMRNRLMGWATNSRQAARYNKRHTRERSDKISQEMMDDLHSPSESRN